MDPATAQASPSPRETHPVQRILVPVQGTDREFLAQDEAVRLAAALEVPVLALHVTRLPDETPPTIFDHVTAECQRWGVALDARMVAGTDPAWEVSQEMGPLDLVVMGTRRAGSRFHVGSIAERLIRCAPARVLLIRLPG